MTKLSNTTDLASYHPWSRTRTPTTRSATRTWTRPGSRPSSSRSSASSSGCRCWSSSSSTPSSPATSQPRSRYNFFVDVLRKLEGSTVDSLVIDTLQCRWRRTRAARASTTGRGRGRGRDRGRSPPRWPGAGGRSWSCSARSSSSSSPVSCPSRYLVIYLAFLYVCNNKIICTIYNIYISSTGFPTEQMNWK